MENEKRLIDANALLEEIQFRRPVIDVETKIVADCVEIARKAIVNAPAVDAVEVVRCKDCKHFMKQNHGRWEIVCKNVRKCSNCKKERNTDDQRGWYSCPFCGTIMDLPNITDKAQAALERLRQYAETST